MIRALALAVVLVVLLWPELLRYRDERRLWTLTTAFQALALRGAAAPAGDRALADIASSADALAAAQPSDPRPIMLAGAARLVARDAAGALERYRAALARGERAEIDLALARCHLGLHDLESAQAALVRAAWVSPALAYTLPKDARRSLLREVKLLARRLRDGRLTASPQLAEADQPSAAR
jgi:tetratricopeptide (TPR) repeat protein